MTFNHRLRLWLVAAFLGAGTMFAAMAPVPVQAGPFESANAYLGAKYDVPDFTLNPAEFGNNNFVRIVHLGVEIIVEVVNGAVVVYEPGSAERMVFVDAGAGYSEPIQTRTTMQQCGPGHWNVQNVGGAIWCTPAHLVGKSGGMTYTHTEAAVPRSCTFEVNAPGSHEHTC